jgi:hypothetical protein
MDAVEMVLNDGTVLLSSENRRSAYSVDGTSSNIRKLPRLPKSDDDVEAGIVAQMTIDPTLEARVVRLDPTREVAIIGCMDGRLRVQDLTTGSFHDVVGHQGAIRDIQFYQVEGDRWEVVVASTADIGRWHWNL